MFICLSPQIISANSSNFPGQTQLSNAVSRDYADYRNDKDFLFSFFFLGPERAQETLQRKDPLLLADQKEATLLDHI